MQHAMPGWLLIAPIVLLIVLLPGGFFMFRAFLRRMAPDAQQQENQG